MVNGTVAAAKDRFFENVASLASSLGAPARLKILHVLAQAPRSVEAVAHVTGESVANTSQHLRRLLGEGMVEVKRDRVSRIYSLRDAAIAVVLDHLFDLAERVAPGGLRAELEVIGGGLGNPATVSDVKAQLSENEAVLIDVRDSYEASSTPVPGALAIPLDSIAHRAAVFSKGKTYFVFCRGRSCDLATEGVRILRKMGFEAYRLKESPISLREAVGSAARAPSDSKRRKK